MGRCVVVSVAFVALIIAGCTGTTRRSPAADRNVITAEEMTTLENVSAYEAVQRLRPHMLQARGATSLSDPSASYPLVYVDGMRRGGIAELRGIPSSLVERIEFISPADATTRWGTGHVGGVIAVTTRS
ncbi:MAG TPA: TonB-dependent receptor plug domain-containing protein [Longimicrobiales bacterium]|nr:TonB-dependent receptor plug domain-containing protein [Longimicrobiales bacterium]